MGLDQHHHNLEEQCSQDTAMVRASTSTVSVSWVAFMLTVIASLSLFSCFAMSVCASLSFSSSALSVELLAALCSFCISKKALFVLSNIIFLFLAADCRFFFCVCSMSPSTGDATDYENPNGVLAKQAQHHQHEMVERCAVQPLVCCSGSHGNSRNEQGKCEHELTSLQSFGLEEEGEDRNNVILEMVVIEEPTCGAAQELDKLQIDKLNRKFEEFIRSRKIKWQQEEALECGRSNLSKQLM